MNEDEMLARLSGALSPWRRVRVVWALAAGLAGAVFTGSLWATEPGPLPARTHVAFAVITAFCAAWAVYGVWALRKKTALLAVDRVIAAWIAVTASVTTTILLAIVARPALAVGGVAIGVSAVLAVQAHKKRAALLKRRQELT